MFVCSMLYVCYHSDVLEAMNGYHKAVAARTRTLHSRCSCMPVGAMPVSRPCRKKCSTYLHSTCCLHAGNPPAAVHARVLLSDSVRLRCLA